MSNPLNSIEAQAISCRREVYGILDQIDEIRALAVNIDDEKVKSHETTLRDVEAFLRQAKYLVGTVRYTLIPKE